MQPTIQLLSRRIREAIAWCHPRADARAPATCLRTLPFELYPFCSRHFLVEEVAVERARRLGGGTEEVRRTTQGVEPLIGRAELQGGRVMAFEPDMYLHERWEWTECGGYLDLYANPPTDTWLLYLDTVPGVEGGALLAWVPEVFVDAVQRAMNINTTRCILWFENLPGPLSHDYRDALGISA